MGALEISFRDEEDSALVAAAQEPTPIGVGVQECNRRDERVLPREVPVGNSATGFGDPLDLSVVLRRESEGDRQIEAGDSREEALATFAHYDLERTDEGVLELLKLLRQRQLAPVVGEREDEREKQIHKGVKTKPATFQ